MKPISPTHPAISGASAALIRSTRSTTSARCSGAELAALCALLVAASGCKAAPAAHRSDGDTLTSASPVVAVKLLTVVEPASATHGELLRAICGDDVGCARCPEDTGRAGEERAGATTARREGDHALVTLEGCEDEDRSFGGGTFVLHMEAEGWQVRDYWAQVLATDCVARDSLGAPALWCQGAYAWHGILNQQLWLIDVRAAALDVSWAPTIECDVASCAEEQVECWDDGTWSAADVDRDGAPELVWSGAHTVWTPIEGADLSDCPEREPPSFTSEAGPARRVWRHSEEDWQELEQP